MGKAEYLEAVREALEELRKRGEKEVVLVHHNDADGLSSAAVLQVALSRAGFEVLRIPLELSLIHI